MAGDDWARYWRADGVPVEAMHAHFTSHVYHRHSHESYSFGVTETGAQAAVRGRHARSGRGRRRLRRPGPPDPVVPALLRRHPGRLPGGGGWTRRALVRSRTMEQRVLGRTGRPVSVIGLGTWQLGADWGNVSESDAMEVLRAAVESGVTFFDTADVYGDGRSERVIGRFLAG